MAPAERARASALIRQRIFQHPIWRSSTRLLCYVSFGSEVDTHALIHEALRFKKKVAVPLHDAASKETLLCRLEQFSQLGPAHRGVMQVRPECHRLVDPSTIELAIIPGIAFDERGGRIGFGGGYFDRLLPKMPNAFRLAPAFSAQIATSPMPLENFDARMQALATEAELLVIAPVSR